MVGADEVTDPVCRCSDLDVVAVGMAVTDGSCSLL